MLYETTGTGTITRSYTWGIGDDDLIAITNHQDGNKRYYVVQDLLRSVRGLVERTGTNGTWRVAWRYTPYGESFTTDGSVNFTVRFRWAGAMLDEETGLYFLRTRSYDPRFGRFIQADVAGFAGGGNLYAYAGGDPATGRDPSGMVSMPEPQYHSDYDLSSYGAWMDSHGFGSGGAFGDAFSIYNFAADLGRAIFDQAAAVTWATNYANRAMNGACGQSRDGSNMKAVCEMAATVYGEAANTDEDQQATAWVILNRAVDNGNDGIWYGGCRNRGTSAAVICQARSEEFEGRWTSRGTGAYAFLFNDGPAVESPNMLRGAVLNSALVFFGLVTERSGATIHMMLGHQPGRSWQRRYCGGRQPYHPVAGNWYC